jgi:hypothetical protein
MTSNRDEALAALDAACEKIRETKKRHKAEVDAVKKEHVAARDAFIIAAVVKKC